MQQGGELAYLIRHDPEFRGVRREHLIEAGRRVRLKARLPAFVEFLERGIDGYQFSFYVVSAAPREVVVSALDGIVPAEHIFGTELDYDPQSGEVRSINRVRAGYGKVAVLDELGQRLGISPDRIIYVGDGSSDIHVMLHVNNGEVSRSPFPRTASSRASRRAPCSATTRAACWCRSSTRCWGFAPAEIRTLLESTGLVLDDWQRDRTDRVQIREAPLASAV